MAGVVKSGKRVKRLAILITLLDVAFIPRTAEGSSAEVVFAGASGAVVVVEAKGISGELAALGSGVVVAPGLVVTNFHVVKNSKGIDVRQGEKKQAASIVASDARRDLSLLRLKDTKLSPIGIRASSSLRVGERVYAIGAPEGLELSLSEGIVSALRPVVEGTYIQTSAAISHGSSGGGLFDSAGRLIGITTFTIVNGQNLNFAIPTEWVTALLGEHSKHFVEGAAASGERRARASESADLTAAEAERAASELFLLGSNQQSAGNVEVARETMAEALRICPTYGPAWAVLSMIQGQLGDGPGALKSAQEGVRLWPNFWGAWYALSWALNDRPDDAGRALDEALKLMPSEPLVMLRSADLSRQQGYFELAVAKYRSLISADSQNFFAWYGLGKAQEGRGNNTEARSAFNEAIRINPEDKTAWWALGFNLVQDGKSVEAIEPLRRSWKLGPDWVVPCDTLCAALNNANRIDEALSQCSACTERFPSDAQALFQLGVVHYRMRDREALLDIHQRLHKLDPKRADQLFRCCVELK